MRQLVSVVTDEAISYLIDDGEGTTQIAKVINTGLEVADVVRLGVNLGEALRLNGYGSGKSASQGRALQRATGNGGAALLPASAAPPPVKHLNPAKAQRVLCPVCAKAYRRSSLSPHLRQVHKWAKAKAQLAMRRAELAPDDAPVPLPRGRAAYEPDAAGPYATPNGSRNRRPSPVELWPKLTSAGVAQYVREHPNVTARDVAQALAGTTDNRAVKTASNHCSRLKASGTFTGELDRGVRGSTWHYRAAT